MRHDVFISYSTPDQLIADAVVALLENNNLRCWIATRDIKLGEDFASCIETAIEECRLVVLIFSEHANTSKYVRREVNLAADYDVQIAPIRIQDIYPSRALKFFLVDCQWMDAFPLPINRHLESIGEKITELLAHPNSQSAASVSGKRRGGSWFQRLFTPSLVASALLIATVIIVFTVTRRFTPTPAPAASANPTGKSSEIVQQAFPPPILNSIGMPFRRLERSIGFKMGSPSSESFRTIENGVDTEVQHDVRITKPFLMGATPVTRAQFARFIQETGFKTDAEHFTEKKQLFGWQWRLDKPTGVQVLGVYWRRGCGFEQADDHPVLEVTWNDAQAFCAWLSKKEAAHYRLPTESEWEFACRAGTQTVYPWGNDPDDGKGFINALGLEHQGDKDPAGKPLFPDPFRWNDGYLFTSPVGKFLPNHWGLYDMIGNVQEWCDDGYEAMYPQSTGEPLPDPRGSTKNGFYVVRGVGWDNGPQYSRCARRFPHHPLFAKYNLGFRVCREL